MMPWLLVGKLAGMAALAGLLLWGYTAARNHFISVDNLHVELSNERDRANRAEVSLGALQMTVDLREKHADELVTIRAESQARINAIREDTQKSKDVLEDRERLKQVTIAKPGLVEKLANKATRKVFDDLEAIYNTD